MALAPETCSECGKLIKGRGIANVFQDRVVCTPCYKVLSAAMRSREKGPEESRRVIEERDRRAAERLQERREADAAAQEYARPAGRPVSLVCPFCEKQGETNLPAGGGPYNAKCLSCGRGFEVLVLEVRAKNSKGSRSPPRREFNIRVRLPGGGEDLVQFVSYSWEDFELRAGDVMALSRDDRGARVIQNLTIGRYQMIQRARGCLAAVLVVAAGAAGAARLAVLR